MESFAYSVAPDAVIKLNVAGNLKVRGWEHAEIRAEASGKDSLKFSEAEGLISLQAWSNARLMVPAGSVLSIESVTGNTKIAGISGRLQITKIGGNLKMSHVGEVEIEKVYGNAAILHSTGDLTLGAVYGNLTVSDAAGNVRSKEKIKGNVVLEWVQGASVTALGNSTLSVRAVEAEHYQIEATGNIHCYLSPGSSAQLQVQSGSGSIRLDLPGKSGKIRETSYRLQVGEGGADIKLNARGYVHVALREPELVTTEFDADFAEDDEISAEINLLIERQMEELEKQISEKLSHIETAEEADLTADIDEIVESARQYSSIAAIEAQSRAEEAARKAQAKLAIKLDKAKRRQKSPSERDARRQGWAGAASSSPGKTGASDEERFLVLKMVEENKISLEEAEQLLAALEGEEA